MYNTFIQTMKYNLLTYIKDSQKRTKHGHRQWVCQCDCGSVHVTKAQSVISGATKSCGCLRGEKETGLSVRNLREYRIWIDMKTRCFNQNSRAFKYYGARGITVCDSWKKSFLTFFKEMGRCPEGLTLDRVDNDGNYEPSNCKWSTRYEQIHNRRKKLHVA